MILTPNLQTTLFKQSSKRRLFKSVGGTTKYENPGENTDTSIYNNLENIEFICVACQ